MKHVIVCKIFLVIAISFFAGRATHAQVSGTTNVITNVEYMYSYSDGNLYDDVYWTVTRGTVEMSYLSTNNTYVAHVVWNETGNGILKIFNNWGDQLGSTTVTITACTISEPTIVPSSFERCGPGPLTLQGASGSGGNTLRWYNTSSGGTLLGTGTSYTTPSLNSATTYYYTSYNSSTGCESTSRSSYTVTIKAVPDLYSNFYGGITPRCGPGSVTLNAGSTNGNEYALWYPSATGGSAGGGGYISVGNTGTATISATTTFYATLVNNSTGCETTNRIGVTATVNPVPSAPSGTGGSVCGSGSVSLNGSPGSNGNVVRWYNVSSGGGVLATQNNYVPTISTTTTYYISSYNTSTGCESTTRASILANINPLPGTPTGTTNFYGCKENTNATTDITLSATPTNANSLRWYARVLNEDSYVSTSPDYTANAISSSKIYAASSYDMSTGCESSGRLELNAIVNLSPSAPSSVISGYTCGPGTVSLSATPSTGGGSVYWYSNPTSSTVLGSSSSFTTPSLSSTTSYFAKTYDPAKHCVSVNYATAVATYKPKPNITASGNGQAICSGTGSAITLATDQSNTTYTYYQEGTNVTGITSASVPTTSTSLSNTFSVANGNSPGTATYYIAGVTDYGTSTPCEGPQKVVVVNVNPIPSLSLVNNISSLCSGQPTSITLFNPNNVSGTVYSWTANSVNASGASTVNNSTAGAIAQTLTATTASTGSVAYNVVPSFSANGKTCSGTSQNTTVSVKAVPVATVAAAQTTFDGVGINFPVTSNISGTIFNYTTSANSNIINANGGFGSPIIQPLALVNKSSTGSVTYNITPNLEGCLGATKTSTVSVYPFPVITSNVPYLSFGNSATVTAQTIYDTYSWLRNSSTTTGVTSITSSQPDNFTLTVTKNGVSVTSAVFELGYQLTGVNQNYVISNVLQFPTSDASRINVVPIDSLIQSITYFDGLGRPAQTISTQGSPLKQDIVQPASYDEYGRESIKYLPFVAAQSNGNYVNNPLGTGSYTGSLHYNFYNNGLSDKIADDAKPYSVTLYEPSPLGRIIKQGATGNSWQPDASSFASPTDRALAFSYEFNGPYEVLNWTYSAPTATYPLGLVNAGATNSSRVYYAANTLFKKRTKDEEHNEVIEYIDKSGNTILKRVQFVAGATAINDSNYASTYYIFDDFNRLVVVISPEAVKAISKTTSDYIGKTDAEKESFLGRWAFRYCYDSRSRITMKQLPGTQSVYMVYDARDRLILTQDGVQRTGATNAIKYWTFTKYDELNRPIMTGIKDTTTTVQLTQPQMQSVVDNHFSKLASKWNEVYIGNGVGNVHGYTNKAYPVCTGSTASEVDLNKYMTVMYYDNYSFRSLWPGDYSYLNESLNETSNGITYTQQAIATNPAIGQVTGTKTKILDGGPTGTGSWIRNVNYFDNRNRPVQNVSDNIAGGMDRSTSIVDFTGKIIKNKTSHSILWRDMVGVESTPTGLTRTLTGTGWTAGAASVDVLPNGVNGWVEVQVAELTKLRMIGLSKENIGTSIAGMDYAVNLNLGNYSVYEKGVNRGNKATITTGDIIRIERTGSTVKYLKNGAVVYTSTVASNSSLMVDATLNEVGATLPNINFSFKNTSPYSIVRRFEFDHAGRLIRTWHKLDSQAEILLRAHTFNEIGQLVDKKLHSTLSSATDAKQSVDYRYNIRGWMTKINESDIEVGKNDASNAGEARDYFGMEIGYEAVIGTTNSSLFNGNISAVKWSKNQGLSSVKESGYNYSYDPLNRLLAASYKEKSTVWNVLANDGFSESNYSYDLNGNVGTLTRYDQRGYLTPMDNLTMIYNTGSASSQSNKLFKVTDTGDVNAGFLDGTNVTSEYGYNANGNMTFDSNKEVKSPITYNYLNLPELLTRGTSNTIRYIYDATGRKLSQIVSYNTSKKRTDYIGDYQYENSVLQSINHEEGRVSIGNEIPVYQNSGDNTAGMTSSNVTGDLIFQNANQSYLKVTANGTTARSGLTNVVTLAVNPGERYKIRAKGYRDKGTSSTSSPVYLLVQFNGADKDFPGATLGSALTSEAWTEQIVTIPAAISTLQAGIIWNTTVTSGEMFFLNDFEVVKLTDNAVPEYQYMLTDHLGNVRVTFTTQASEDVLSATLEDNTQGMEQAQFNHYSRVTNDLFDHTDAGTIYDKVQLLSGGNNSQVGLTKSLSVMPGDIITAEVYAKYFGTTGGSGNINAFAYSLLSAFMLPTPAVGEVGTAARAINDYANFIAAGNNPGENNWPKGFLNVLVFDKNYNLIDLAFQQLDGAFVQTGATKSPHQLLNRQVVIKEPGYVYIYVSNEGNVQQDIYFDDFKITHTKSPVIQQSDYYAFGLAFNESHRENSLTNNYQYSGKEKQDELGVNWLDYGARMYMSDIGRWGAIDPLAEKAKRWSPYNYAYNNPIRNIDPDGMFILEGEAAQVFLQGLLKYSGGDNQSNENDAATSEFFERTSGGDHITAYSSDAKAKADEVQQSPKNPFGEIRAVTPFYGNFTGSNADHSTYFEGVSIFTSEVGALKDQAAFTLPGVGIFVNPLDATNIKLLSHEFGHILQAQIWGNDFFYGTIVPASVKSANRANNDYDYDHQGSWTEWTANWFSYNYFGKPADWDKKEYSIEPKSGSYPPVGIFDFYSTTIPQRPENWIYYGK